MSNGASLSQASEEWRVVPGHPATIPSADAERCRRCGANNPPWHAPSPLWNAVMRGGSINGEAAYDDMVCATCFMVLAEARGIATIWRVQAMQVKVPLETVTPSGRVWDDKQFLWVDAPASKLARFLANPPRRISATAVKKRKAKSIRTYPGGWRAHLYKRQKGRCQYCKAPMGHEQGPREATIDHVLPISRGGRNSRDNVVLACQTCNQAKGSMTGAEFRAAVPKADAPTSSPHPHNTGSPSA